ncbi:MAG: hypothetical protein RH946_14370 [Rhodospirillales bacterium]
MSEHTPKVHDPKKYWLDDPRNVRKIIIALIVVCAGLLIVDVLYEKHPHFAAEEWFGFYAIFGFVMCVGLVLVAKLMRVFLMRDEEYYDKNE